MARINRPFLKIQIPAAEEDLWALGLVAYVWTALENDLDLWTYTANGRKMPTTEDGKRLGFRGRARFLKEIIKAKVNEPPRKLFIDTIDGILGIQDERDRLLHWLWGENEEGGVGVSDWKEQKKTNAGFAPREFTVSVARLIELTQKIDGYRATLAEIMFSNGSKDGFILLSNAWQHISRKLDQPI